MAATDILTLAEAKRALNITSDTQNTEIASYITAVSLRLDGLCGPVVQRTVTSESHDGGCSRIFLRQYPVASVTAVVEYDNTTATTLTAESNTTKTSTNYLLDTRKGIVSRRSSNWAAWFPSGMGNVLVTYTAGRAASTTASAENFKQAAAIMLSSIWRKEQGSGTVTFGGPGNVSEFVPGAFAAFSIPDAVRQLLGDELLPPRVG